MWKLYLPTLITAALITGGLTYSVKLLAEKIGIFDQPGPRKIHPKAIPRLGGVAIVLAFIFLAIGYSLVGNRLNFDGARFLMIDSKLIGVLLGALVLLVVGIFDDVRGLKPIVKLFWHIISAVIVVAFGISISYIRLPAGEHVELTHWIIHLTVFKHLLHFLVWSDLITVFWIVLMINTLNFLDGLDGLASGISVIAGLVIFSLSIILGQPASALLAMIFTGSVLGFLPWNFNPAKIFMGDSGSMFLGYLLAVLSVISGGKLATAFLVLGIPVLDVGWVAIRRILSGTSPFSADKFHLHHRLMTAGLTQKQAVIILYLISAIFGSVAIFNQTEGKIHAFVWLFAIMIVLAIVLIILDYWRKQKERNV